ncbi:MAG: T9SS type A sorting domain-containing protein, partial [Fibromonadaceae bacterium]|nr:T9SS type A sorting domain-containing protein [Fibromonadaceae bacterium]
AITAGDCSATQKFEDGICRAITAGDCSATQKFEGGICRAITADDCTKTQVFESGICRAITAGDCSATQKFEGGICRAITADDCSATQKFEGGICRAITADDCSATQMFEGGVCRAITANDCFATQMFENGVCRNKTLQELCAEIGDIWVDGQCKTTIQLAEEMCLANGGIWKDNTCHINTQDNTDITTAKTTLESTNFGPVSQSTLNTQGMARGFIEDIIAELNLNNVSATVSNIAFTPASTGTVENLTGTNGSYAFSVTLNKGAGTQQIVAGTLTITAMPYPATQENTDITTAKTTLESTNFGSVPQSTLNTQGMARGFIEDILAEFELNNVETTVTTVSFQAAIAGATDNEFGTNGVYEFTITLNKGIGAEQTTEILSLIITATPYSNTPIRLPQIATFNQATQIYNGISLQSTSNAMVEIYGLKGNLINRQNFGNGVYTVSFEHLPKGMYIVRVSFGSEKQILRVPVR